MTKFEDWRNFDFRGASIQLWVFKKSTTSQRYRAWHVRTDEYIENLFRETIALETQRITETHPYSHLSQTNENSCLHRELAESENLIALLQLVDAPESEASPAGLKQLKGAVAYLVKFEGELETVYAVRKTGPVWKPTKRKTLTNVVFSNGELSVAPAETFSFDSKFDFYCFRETIFIASKRAYEGTVSDKKVYERSFESLITDQKFSDAFSSLDPLKKYVGKNAMHLRRMTVIQQKGLYNIEGFSDRLKAVSLRRGWDIKFDQNNRIELTNETVKTVVQVLLDHRLLSELTDTTYDVPDAEAID